MLEHQRALDELALGLLTPSDSEWNQGAGRLLVAALRSGDLPPDPKTCDGEHQTGRNAGPPACRARRSGQTTETRSAAYASILATCADCHGLHRIVWGPRSPK